MALSGTRERRPGRRDTPAKLESLLGLQTALILLRWLSRATTLQLGWASDRLDAQMLIGINSLPPFMSSVCVTETYPSPKAAAARSTLYSPLLFFRAHIVLRIILHTELLSELQLILFGLYVPCFFWRNPCVAGTPEFPFQGLLSSRIKCTAADISFRCVSFIKIMIMCSQWDQLAPAWTMYAWAWVFMLKLEWNITDVCFTGTWHICYFMLMWNHV